MVSSLSYFILLEVVSQKLRLMWGCTCCGSLKFLELLSQTIIRRFLLKPSNHGSCKSFDLFAIGVLCKVLGSKSCCVG